MRKVNALLVILSVSTISGFTCAQDLPQEPSVNTIKVAGNIYMIEGLADPEALLSGDLSNFSGGNIGLSVGADGVLIVDAKMALFAEKVKAAIKELGGGSPRFILDTHSHNDHINGNPEYRRDRTIISHRNARIRILEEKPADYWPVITFDQTLSLYLNGEEIKALHYPSGHTDGDIVVYFVFSNVIHMGDLYFSGYLPYVDLDSGGTVQGYMDNIKSILDKIDDTVRIIPGHGPVSSRDDLQTYYRLIREITTLVTEQMASGKSLNEIKETGLQEEWESWSWFLVTPEKWIEAIYRSYSGNEAT